MLESLGLGEIDDAEEADVLVFNTCTIREKPDTKLAAHLGNAAARKRRRPDTIIAVGGCFAEAQRDAIFTRYPFVDVAFGPGSIPHLGEWIGAGGVGVARGRFGTHEHFAGALPHHRERRHQAWVQVSMGCNSVCSYCIVPAVRGREQSRRPGEIVAEVQQLAREGVREITLLGQNVNSWGRDLTRCRSRLESASRRACDAIEGIERVRFTSPHPKDFREPVIAAMAECSSVCEHVHLPLQSGSSRVLKAMKVDLRRRPVPPTRRPPAQRGSRSCNWNGSHRWVPGGDRGRFPRDPRPGRGGALRQRVHVRLLTASGHGGGRDGRPGIR